MKKLLPYIIITALVLIAGLIIFYPNPASSLPKEPVLFVGEGCPHCQKVEDFIKNNEVDKKINFSVKEVWYNQGNAILMNKVWKQCGLNPRNMGVPFYWDGNNCLSGEVEIINYFQSKIK